MILTPIILCTVLYVALGAYYKNSFSFGTWVNDIYCTGKTAEVINEELRDKTEETQIRIIKKDGTEEFLDLSRIQYTEDYREPLQRLQDKQNPFLWGKNLFNKNTQVLLPVISFDKELLRNELLKLDFMQVNTQTASPRVEIVETENGYALFDNTSAIIDKEKAIIKVISAIAADEKFVKLDDGICYKEYSVTQAMKDTYALWEKVKEFQNFRMVYLFGDSQEVLDAAILADWITKTEDDGFALDEKDNLILDESMIAEYVASLASEYDTIGGTRQFKATRGDTVTIEGGTYGNQIDQKAEVEYLTEAYLTHNEADKIPVYKKSAWKQGTDDIGDTYIEIDMGEQMMYYYQKGVLKIETPIVTGNVSRKHSTPERVCYVYAKQKNRTLRGPGYASHVNFWMPVNGGIGIHDALWRKEFGGDIYKKSGSHGCINTPYDIMKELYNMVEIGTPVVMFN